jgi:hypothetical protein
MHRLVRISYKVLKFYGIKFTTQIGAVFAEPHWPAQVLLREVEQRLRIADRFAGWIED